MKRAALVLVLSLALPANASARGGGVSLRFPHDSRYHRSSIIDSGFGAGRTRGGSIGRGLGHITPPHLPHVGAIRY